MVVGSIFGSLMKVTHGYLRVYLPVPRCYGLPLGSAWSRHTRFYDRHLYLISSFLCDEALRYNGLGGNPDQTNTKNSSFWEIKIRKYFILVVSIKSTCMFYPRRLFSGDELLCGGWLVWFPLRWNAFEAPGVTERRLPAASCQASKFPKDITRYPDAES